MMALQQLIKLGTVARRDARRLRDIALRGFEQINQVLLLKILAGHVIGGDAGDIILQGFLHQSAANQWRGR